MIVRAVVCFRKWRLLFTQICATKHHPQLTNKLNNFYKSVCRCEILAIHRHKIFLLEVNHIAILLAALAQLRPLYKCQNYMVQWTWLISSKKKTPSLQKRFQARFSTQSSIFSASVEPWIRLEQIHELERWGNWPIFIIYFRVPSRLLCENAFECHTTMLLNSLFSVFSRVHHVLSKN